MPNPKHVRRYSTIAGGAWLLLAAAIQPTTAAMPESWADKNLKVTGGLVAWFDSLAENPARSALKKPRARNGAPLDTWHDASGNGRHLVQNDPTARPTMRDEDEWAGVRFGGVASYLALDKLGLTLGDVTCFIVAAEFSNDGNFRALLAMNAEGANDYVSGLNIDQGSNRSSRFGVINVEGAGFGGAKNLKRDTTPFGRLHRICVTSTVGPGGTTLAVNGAAAGRRDRSASTIGLDRLTVGARYYTNGGPPQTRGFMYGEIDEVLIYDRLLSESERAEVDKYLQAKYGNLRAVRMPEELLAARPVPRVADPPPVQMLAPGFAVRELKVDLTNINNVRYRHDGTLVAMAYDGRVYLLTDSDGDGLEDRASAFTDEPAVTSPIGIALTPPGYARGQGVFVAGKGRIALILDKDGDDRADEVVTVAEGWPAIINSVDALGVALAPDGSLYFGLGTQDYTNGYLLDADKHAHYKTDSQRGAIFKVTSDFKHRERICSGVRFTVALAFNRAGDLFCTDQEGATWLANGNPFDELLHIQHGRHYGFPPRHPRHLSGVVDEPSVYDFSPQHQSLCGLCFNESAAEGQIFGPDWWRGNALACGYSRGKLFRTTLVKTPLGYVADTAVLGCLNMLTLDACLSPRGELVVAAHGGGPDWGSGPGGKGKLYKITYADTDCPQSVRAWVNRPGEVQIAFDRPLAPQEFQHLARETKIEYGEHVRAGDRFESLWPGYSVVEGQMQSVRKLLPVLAAGITADRRSIVLSTEASREAVHYCAMLPAPRREASSPPPGVLPQLPTMELTFDLSGVEARWQGTLPDEHWTTWMPHLDPRAATGLLNGSAEGQRLKASLARPGKLVLATQLDLGGMLRPAVQSDAKLDYEPAPEEVTLVFESAGDITLKHASQTLHSKPNAAGRHRLAWTIVPHADQWPAIEVTATTGGSGDVLDVGWFTAEDARPRAMAQRRFFVPWAQRTSDRPPSEHRAPKELAGGDWRRGREAFFGEQAQCGKCHRVHDKGGWIGPDLSNLVHRDYASVLRDIAEPSFAVNPDHLAYNVLVNDGRVLTGMIQPRGDQLVVGDIKGIETTVARGDVESITPTLLSIMPDGLPKAIGADGMRDLLTFLLTKEPGALAPAPITRPGAPPPRSRAEVDAVLNVAPAKGTTALDPSALKLLQIVLVAGPKDHDENEHDYPQWQARWKQLLSLAPRVEVTTADRWPSTDAWQGADVAVFFSANPDWTPERAKDLDALLGRGGGLVFLHYAVNGRRAPDELARRIGLAVGDASRYRHGALDLRFNQETDHPITAGFKSAKFVDESYWNMVGNTSKIQVLATQDEEGQPRPMLWTFEPGRGRVVGSILGHYTWTFDDPLYRVLLLRAITWTARERLDRFNDLVTPGARIVP